MKCDLVHFNEHFSYNIESIKKLDNSNFFTCRLVKHFKQV